MVQVSYTSQCRQSLLRSSLLLLLLSCHIDKITSYISSKGALSGPRQVQFLKQITGEICESPTGKLSDTMIADSHKIMKGWSHLSTNTKTAGSAENAVAVENLVKRLIDETKAGNTKANPTTNDYNCMLESWARSGKGDFAAERCEQILTQMQEGYEAGDRNVQPNLSSFKVAIMAWKHAGGHSLSSFRAQRILEWMVTLYTEGKNDLAFPDAYCFDSVLQSWSRNTHKRSPLYAETLLGSMEKLSVATQSPKLAPRTLSYNAVLGAWARSKDPNAWTRSCEILSFMEKLSYVEGNKMVEPDRVSYLVVLGALARSGDPAAAAKADSILKNIEKQKKAGMLSWDLDTMIYNQAMATWAHSNKKGAYRKNRSLLDRQIHQYTNGCAGCRPDVVGFTSVLASCASESGDKTNKAKAFNVALSTFQQLLQNQDDYGSPNHVSYGTMLKCVSQLLPPSSAERKRWTSKLFKECAAKGLVGGMVLSRLREAATPEQYKELMQGNTKSSLPPRWTRNVDEKNEYRRKSVGRRAEV
jgi:hypothetical protein